ncbi:hypothetical protein CH330_09370 [candidate division WOR-3 bacterium JGI_Cruoil_03_51_56]|uniref:Uncharacterized protein n=1 Tax=candidate division WOR-3 bacterium JGI_Cruoil_03_51_56 TaxID=1973747 RepID=A0A235BQW1_UNCW3|nr:MAG: hypothetical protein CH330_09370 [candidate division WOR-3 bacterium JGI_Cruoil_03_51_56]
MGKDIQEQSLVVETKCRFHLCSATPEQAVEIIQGLKDLGIKKVGPAHCTGDKDVQTKLGR